MGCKVQVPMSRLWQLANDTSQNGHWDLISDTHGQVGNRFAMESHFVQPKFPPWIFMRIDKAMDAQLFDDMPEKIVRTMDPDNRGWHDRHQKEFKCIYPLESAAGHAILEPDDSDGTLPVARDAGALETQKSSRASWWCSRITQQYWGLFRVLAFILYVGLLASCISFGTSTYERSLVIFGALSFYFAIFLAFFSIGAFSLLSKKINEHYQRRMSVEMMGQEVRTRNESV